MKKLAVFALTGLLITAALAGCGKKDETPVETMAVNPIESEVNVPEETVPAETESVAETETSDEDVPPEEGMVRSPLTNEWISGDLADQRPIAVMVPNENACLPQYSISQADILYECNVEGSMTRLMAVFKDWKNLERIGNIRSCRDYYVYWAKEWDAIYCHAGGPFYILPIINDPTTDNITGVTMANDKKENKGLVDSYLFRTSDRSAPHNAYTSGELVASAISKLGYSETYTENYTGDHFKFASGENTLEQYDSAFTANKIDLADVSDHQDLLRVQCGRRPLLQIPGHAEGRPEAY